MPIQAMKSLLIAVLGLVVAASLGFAVVSVTREQDLLSSVPEDAGLALTPGDSKSKSMRDTANKPVVVTVGPDGKAVVQSGGGSPAAPRAGQGGQRIPGGGKAADD